MTLLLHSDHLKCFLERASLGILLRAAISHANLTYHCRAMKGKREPIQLKKTITIARAHLRLACGYG